MHSKAQSCYIRSDDPSFKTVYLPDCTSVFVGRCIETNIADPTVSRKQGIVLKETIYILHLQNFLNCYCSSFICKL